MMNVAGDEEVGHPEYDQDVSSPLFIMATCPVETRPEGAPRLWGNLKIKITPESIANQIYRCEEISEAFTCNFELNPDYRQILEASGAKICGVSETGIVQMVEFPKNNFYVITGFLPQLASEENKPHPIITNYLKAAKDYQKEKIA